MTPYTQNSETRRALRGLDWVLLRALPVAGVAGIVIPALLAYSARFWMAGSTPEALAQNIRMFDFWMIGAIVVFWGVFMTVTVSCVLAWVIRQRRKSLTPVPSGLS